MANQANTASAANCRFQRSGFRVRVVKAESHIPQVTFASGLGNTRCATRNLTAVTGYLKPDP